MAKADRSPNPNRDPSPDGGGAITPPRAVDALRGTERGFFRLPGVVRNARRGVIIILAIAAACGAPPDVDAADVERCLADALGSEGWAEIPLSDAGTVYGVDFGPNSVQLYIEANASAVDDQVRSIREAEDAVGNTGPGDRVILRDRGNVLVSWANEPTADQSALVERCVGFS